MIKYHGTPCTPVPIFYEAFTGRNVLVPFPRRDDMKKALRVSDKIILDNGAYSIWKKGGSVSWDKYYIWVDTVIHRIENFFIPDVIGGTEDENDVLIDEFLTRYTSTHWGPLQITKAIPVWHIDESFERIKRLMLYFDYIAIGSAGEYQTLGTKKWHARMDEAMGHFCDKDGKPKVKIHMLRCLNHKIFTRYPFYSGDSTNVARNHGNKDKQGNVKGWRPIMGRIEAHDSPESYIYQ